MFRGQITPEILSEVINYLVTLNYFSDEDTSEEIQKLAQFKLFGLVQILHKLKLGELQKGLKNASDLWI